MLLIFFSIFLLIHSLPSEYKFDEGFPFSTYCWLYDSRTDKARIRSQPLYKYCEVRYFEAENGTYHYQCQPFLYHFDAFEVDEMLERRGETLFERKVNDTMDEPYVQFICHGSGCNGNVKSPELFRRFHAKWVEWRRNETLEVKGERVVEKGDKKLKKQV